MNRIVVGAHYGLKDWLAQRITAIVMAVYTVVFVAGVFGGATSSAEAWRHFLGGGLMRFATFLFIVSLVYHAWIGVRDIFMDYIKPTGLRLVLLVGTIVLLVAYTCWAVLILWRV